MPRARGIIWRKGIGQGLPAIRAAQADNPGVHVTLPELMRLRLEATQLSLAGPDVVSGLLPGLYRSLFRGRGLDFEEVRAYQQGDDYRVLDWRVTARTGKLHTKVFREEREHTVFFAVDAGPSMHFGTRQAFKWTTAARAAAIIAWLAADNGDRIGGLVFGDGRLCHEQKPLNGQTGALHLFRLLERASLAEPPDIAEEERSGLADALTRIRRLARPGSLILLFSDFRGLDRQAREHLAYLTQHNDVAALFLYDPLEQNLPSAGHYAFTDGDQTVTLETGDEAVREAFHSRFTEHQEQLSDLCRRYRVKLGQLGTHESLIDGLKAGLFRRPVGNAGRRNGRG